MVGLAERLKPCGPVIDAHAAGRVLEALGGEALAWDALAPVFGASPYLAGLARRWPHPLRGALASDPDERLAAIVNAAGAVASDDIEAVKRDLRRLKAELHLLTALCDLGGVWDLVQVTGALTDFADAALYAALAAAAQDAIERGRMARPGSDEHGPVPGFFGLALGKHGAGELNYSSDIDVSFFYEPDRLPVADGVEPQALALRLTQTLAAVMQERTPEGYVFRVDLRLRPDPSSTPAAIPVEAAFDYYESVGQNWERAAMIKARPAVGDLDAGKAFVAELQPFIWRRNLDYAAIADIQSIKQQIHVVREFEEPASGGLQPAGANLKLGPGGIREIEFYAQTQQLIAGGRDPSLRAPRTVDAIRALQAADYVAADAAEELTDDYARLRALEHRIQMLRDEQTHTLPAAAEERRRVAALSGYDDLRKFDAYVGAILKRVNQRYGELFAEAEPLSSPFGSLVFTGVEDDPETLQTLERMGFSQPAQVSGAIRSWHHGRIAATRTERGRELFTRLAPRLLEAAHATGAPDAAFNRFADFFSALSSGVQIQSLLLAEPRLFDLVVEVMAFAPRLAATLARKPAVLDAMLDRDFFDPLETSDLPELERAIVAAGGYEAAMDVARRLHRERAFRIGVQVMAGSADAAAAGKAHTALADACIRALSSVSLAETDRLGGRFPGQVAVIALGKAGSREMTARSDLDLMTLYRADAPDAISAGKGWGAETFYSRFTQRLLTALSSPTAEGELYPVDMQLRPSGSAGPVAVSIAAFESYYEHEAETWEFLALTRARVVWASSDAFAAEAGAAVERALRRPRDPVKLARDVAAMRALMTKERPASGFWDLKLSPGGLVDIEFAAQAAQIAHAADGGPLASNTGEALEGLRDAGLIGAGQASALLSAWTLQQDLGQVLKVALGDDGDPAVEPPRFQALLARSGMAGSFAALDGALKAQRRAAHAAYDDVVRQIGRAGKADG
jgi:glutamate-ammonia-ligase adenylyltransferase